MPDWTSSVRDRLQNLGVDPATEAEIIDELSQHVADRHRDLVARGVTATDAEVLALRELDGHETLRREIARLKTEPLAPTQNTTRAGWTGVWDDVVFAWRRLWHSPGFASAALLTMTLTVGANTAILTVADAVLFRPLPYADPDHVAIIQMKSRTSGRQSTSTSNAFLSAVNDGCPDVSEVGLLEPGPRVTVDGPDGPAAVAAMVASPNYFRLLGVKAAHGRMFEEQDTGGEGRVAVLSYAAWQQRFAGDPSIVRRSVTIGASTFDIVGVLPAGFYFPSLFAGRPSLVVMGQPLERGVAGGTFHAIVRVAPGVSLERAQAEVEAAVVSVPDSGKQYPYLNDVRSILYPIGRPVMRYLIAAGALIFLLGCANLANMLLVRGRRRLGETAVRLALGATRARLIRPIVFEAFFLGAAGAALATLIAALAADLILRQVPRAAYGEAPVGVDARVIGITFAVALLGSAAFSIVPAWRLARVDVLSLLQRRGNPSGRRTWFGRPMVSVQVAIAIAVVFGAAVAGRSFLTILATPIGFSSDRVVRVGMAAPANSGGPSAFFQQVMDVLARRRDVESVGAVGSLPFSREAANFGATIEGNAQPAAGGVYVLPGYFDTVRIPVLRGRVPTWDDVRSDESVAVVSVSAMGAMFGNRDAIGATFTDGRDRHFHVIGVVGDVWNSYSLKPEPRAYVLPGPRTRALNIVLHLRDRHATAPAEITADLRTLATAFTVEWWDDLLTTDPAYRDPRFQTQVFVGLATLALGLTALGIFSVVAYLVSARTRELGVRLAIGASPRSLVGLMVRQSLWPVAIGLAGGLVLAFWGGKLAEAQFFRVDASDPRLLGLALVTVVVAALAAAYLPARRATRINPADVLRAE